jgi:hypothetical protein
MKKLLLVAVSLFAFASFAEDGPCFPYDMNAIVNAPGYDPSVVHEIQDRDRPVARDRDFRRHGWYVHGRTPYYYGGHAGGYVWYPATYGRPGYYGPAPAAAVGGAIVAGAVVGAATVACCCW